MALVTISDDTYYSALQSALVAYDAKLWQIPALFFTALGWLFLILDTRDILTLRNGVIAWAATVALSVLVLLHNKAHIFHLSIQFKINEFDRQNQSSIARIPLNSMKPMELIQRMKEMEEQGAWPFKLIQTTLASVTVSRFISWSMIIITLIVYFFAFVATGTALSRL